MGFHGIAFSWVEFSTLLIPLYHICNKSSDNHTSVMRSCLFTNANHESGLSIQTANSKPRFVEFAKYSEAPRQSMVNRCISFATFLLGSNLRVNTRQAIKRSSTFLHLYFVSESVNMIRAVCLKFRSLSRRFQQFIFLFAWFKILKLCLSFLELSRYILPRDLMTRVNICYMKYSFIFLIHAQFLQVI